jgi:hypothetical protein
MCQTLVHPSTQKILILEAQIDPNTVIVGDLNTHCHQELGHPDKKTTKKPHQN